MALTEDEKRERRRVWYLKNRESELARGRAWRAANRDKKQATDRAWIAKNYDHKRATEKAWRDNNPERKLSAVNACSAKNRDHHRAVLDAWRKANPDKVQAAALRARVKAKADPVKRMRNTLKAQLNAVLKGKASRTGIIATFGYTMEQLVAHLEARFAPGMTWEA